MGRTEEFVERAFTEEERKELLKTNKYWNADKSEFDPVDIIVEGNYPTFTSQGDKFRCVMSLATWLCKRQYGIDGIAEPLAKYLESLEDDMLVLFMRQQNLQVIEAMTNHEAFTRLHDRMTGVIT